MAEQLVQATIAELKAHAPFDRMEPESLQLLGRHLQVAYYPKGTEVIGPAAGAADRLWIVKRGAVTGRPSSVSGNSGVAVSLGTGECFPIGALVGKRATQYSYRTDEDSFLYELGADSFGALLERSPRFQAFCTAHLASLVDRSHRELRLMANEALAETGNLLEPLARLASRAPVTCAPQTSLRAALGTMAELGIGSIVVVDGVNAPVGILTHADVLDRVTLPGIDLETAIEAVMTRNPFSLPAEAPIFEAALAMVRLGIRHVILSTDGRVTGMVSERDLFALQRVSLRRTAQQIRGGQTVEALQSAAAGTRDLVRSLLAQGFGAEQLTQVITSLNDSLLERLVEISAKHGALAGRWCWIALGSEGRSEQTLATDQDNALILGPDADGPAARALFLEFADELNRALDACGFPLCIGNIMARNPQWCMTLAEWRTAFSKWIRNAEPQALLNASIFFDFRALAGDASLPGELRQSVLEEASGNPAFLRAMAVNALKARPPIGLFRNFVTDDSAEFPDTIDLKKFGTRPFIDAARIYALAHRVPDTNTAARLRKVAQRGGLPQREASDAVDAFQFIQTLRIRHQFLESNLRAGAENRISPDAVNALDRRILKEAFRQAVKLQEKLALDYQV